MGEWLKHHTYIVCGTKQQASQRMEMDWFYSPKFQHDIHHWDKYSSKLCIVGKDEVYQYVSVRQVINGFDGIDDVDYFELDASCSHFPKDYLISVISMLHSAGMKRRKRGIELSKF